MGDNDAVIGTSVIGMAVFALPPSNTYNWTEACRKNDDWLEYQVPATFVDYCDGES